MSSIITTVAAPSMGLLARAAVLWNASFNILKDILQFVITMVLSRLLSEDSYGQLGFVTGVTGFLIIFSFQVFVSHILQVKTDAEVNYQHHFTFGVVVNSALCVVTNIVAWGVTFYPAWAAAAPFIHVMSVMFLLDVPCEIRRKMLERSYDWKTLRILHAIGLFINLIGSVAMAWAGWGTYALLVPGFVGIQLPFIYDLFIRKKWRPDWSFNRAEYRESLSFGITRLGSGLTLTGKTLLESTVLVAHLGFGGLGFMTRATGLAQNFCLKIASQLIYAIYPMLTRVEEDKGQNGKVGSLVLQYVAWFSIPTGVVFSMLAMAVITTCFGDKWLSSVPLVPGAMAWGVAAALYHASYMLTLSKNMAKICFGADIGNLLVSLVCLFLVLSHGLPQYLAATAIGQILLASVLLAILVRKRVVLLKGVLLAIFPPLLASLCAAGLTSLFFHSIFKEQPTKFFPALGWGMIYLSLHLLILRIGFRNALETLVQRLPASKYLGKALAI